MCHFTSAWFTEGTFCVAFAPPMDLPNEGEILYSMSPLRKIASKFLRKIIINLTFSPQNRPIIPPQPRRINF
jgi:hypothetical protein